MCLAKPKKRFWLYLRSWIWPITAYKIFRKKDDHYLTWCIAARIDKGLGWLHERGFRSTPQGNALTYPFGWHAYKFEHDASKYCENDEIVVKVKLRNVFCTGTTEMGHSAVVAKKMKLLT